MRTRAFTLVVICALATSAGASEPDASAAPVLDNAAALSTVSVTPLQPFLAPVPATPSRALKATFWGGAAAGGVLLTLGAVFGVLSETHAAAANERFDARTLTAADRHHYDAARFDAKVANVSFGAGAAALVAAAVAYLINPGVAGEEQPAAGAVQ